MTKCYVFEFDGEILYGICEESLGSAWSELYKSIRHGEFESITFKGTLKLKNNLPYVIRRTVVRDSGIFWCELCAKEHKSLEKWYVSSNLSMKDLPYTVSCSIEYARECWFQLIKSYNKFSTNLEVAERIKRNEYAD